MLSVRGFEKLEEEIEKSFCWVEKKDGRFVYITYWDKGKRVNLVYRYVGPDVIFGAGDLIGGSWAQPAALFGPLSVTKVVVK